MNKMKKIKKLTLMLSLMFFTACGTEGQIDTTKPFGHEMVLYTMLKEDSRNNYPWNIYYKENQDIYNGLI